MSKNNINYETPLLGTWGDKQVPNTYSHYADFVMETLLMKVLPKMQQETDLELMTEGKIAKIKQGHAIFFASFIRHRVKPVIRGNRKSLVMWFGGTPFK